jgi:molybdopterin-guanine dinucleotide biosynthesis protein B
MIVVSFVATSSNSGKTTLIEKIVTILTSRGMRVAVIKHAPGGFDLDRPGKDSWRFQQAGADTVILVGPDRMAIMKTIDHQPSSEEIERLAEGADIVIYEGFKKDAKNKIEIFRRSASGEHPLCMTDPSYLALVSDSPCVVSIPQFDLSDADGVAAFVLDNKKDALKKNTRV